MYPSRRKQIGQHAIVVNRLGPDLWKVQVIDMDVPEPSGRFVYSAEGWPTWRQAMTHGERRISKMDEAACFRSRLRYDRVARMQSKKSV